MVSHEPVELGRLGASLRRWARPAISSKDVLDLVVQKQIRLLQAPGEPDLLEEMTESTCSNGHDGQRTSAASPAMDWDWLARVRSCDDTAAGWR